MSEDAHGVRPDYRPDIDGLRALAVIAVIAYHAFPTAVPGGFVGVDVFFVISGFLISQIVLRDAAAARFTFAGFYVRRIRRLLPSLIAVLFGCAALGWAVLMPDELTSLGQHTAAGAGFGSNILLWWESGYFDAASESKPLLHLWSLSVEEQFYLVWPALLTVQLWGTQRRLAVISIVVVSFGACVWMASTAPVANFYLPGTRLWELGAGSLLALMLHRRGTTALFTTAWAQVAAAGGLVGVVAACFVISRSTPFPGWSTLVPVFGAWLLIAAGTGAGVNRLLGHRVLVGVGLISFPLYLWHWPLLTYCRIFLGREPDAAIIVGAVAVSTGLAFVTYRWVERPLRFGPNPGAKAIGLAAMLFVTGGTIFLAFARDGAPSRIDPGSMANWKPVRSWSVYGPGVTPCTFNAGELSGTFCGTTDAPTVALIGDSHAGHLFPGFWSSPDPRINRVVVMGAGACFAAQDYSPRVGCARELDRVLDHLRRSPGIRTVIVAGFWGIPQFDSPAGQQLLQGHMKTFDTLKRLGKAVIFVVDNPGLPFNPDMCLRIRPIHALWSPPIPDQCQAVDRSAMVSSVDYSKLVTALRRAAPEVIFYDPTGAICPGGRCNVFQGRELLWGDWNHVSTYGSRLVAADFLADGALQQRLAQQLILAGDTTSPVARVLLTRVDLPVPAGFADEVIAEAFDAGGRPVVHADFSWHTSAGTLTVEPDSSRAILNGLSSMATVTASSGDATATASIGPATDMPVVDDDFSVEGLLQGRPPLRALPGTSWVVTGDVLTSQDGRLRIDRLATRPTMATIEAGVADGLISVDWSPARRTHAGYPAGGVVFRMLDDSNFWVACEGCGSYKMSLWKVTAGTWSLVLSQDQGDTAGSNHRWEIRLRGPQINVWWDSRPIMRVEDSYAARATRHGVLWQAPGDTSSSFDRFSIWSSGGVH